MDTPLTSTGKACKKCLAKGPGEKCHLHCSKGTAVRSASRTVTKKTPAKTRRPRSSPKSKSPSATGRKKAKAGSPPSPLTHPKSLSPPRSPMAMSPPVKSMSPVRQTPPRSLEKEWRLGRESPDLRNLGWESSEAKRYVSPDAFKRDERYYTRKNMIPIPEEFAMVYQKMKDICQSIKEKTGRHSFNFRCNLHPTYPGLQWDNKTSEFNKVQKTRKKEMGKNHYYHSYNKNRDNLPLPDKGYCSCNELHQLSNSFKTLLLPFDGKDEEWEAIHGSYETGNHDEDNWARTERKVSPELRSIILKDSVETLGQEYKIHIQPKPEYQLPILRIIANLIITDADFMARVESWKAVVPYHRTVSEMSLPSIVVYPALGAKNAKIVLQKIIKALEPYDAAKIGLNHTPRFNKKYNELIYYAGGSGDHKLHLPDELFTKGKEFYKGYELKL